MTLKCRRTLRKIFQDPPPKDLSWADIEDCLEELAHERQGICSRGSSSGTRTLVKFDGVIGVFFYPQKVNRSTLEDVREFLEKARIRTWLRF